MSPQRSVPLGRGVVFEVWGPLSVCTRFPDGARAHATRDDGEAERAEAADQGYGGPEKVRRSLIDHELLHTLIARALENRESRVLRHEAQAERSRYALRLHEEALAISAQTFLNLGIVDPVLRPELGRLKPVWPWLRRLRAEAGL